MGLMGGGLSSRMVPLPENHAKYTLSPFYLICLKGYLRFLGTRILGMPGKPLGHDQKSRQTMEINLNTLNLRLESSKKTLPTYPIIPYTKTVAVPDG
jgi:hypothetical protein